MKEPQIACSHARQYKGLNPPKCGCLSCRLLYVEKRLEVLVEHELDLIKVTRDGWWP